MKETSKNKTQGPLDLTRNWSFKEAAPRIGVSQRLLEQLAHSGAVRVLSIGKRRKLIPHDEMARLLGIED